MSATNELAELRASISRAHAELDAASERLATLERAKGGGDTVIIRRWRRRDWTIAIGSSAATAVLIGLFGLASPKSAPVVAVTPPVLPEPVVIRSPDPPPPPVVVEPPPAPVVVEPPRPPHPVRAVSMMTPPALAEMGTLTIVCLPSKCDQIIDNGVPIGPGHIFAKPVAAGPHRLQLRSPTGETKTLRIEVQPGQLRDVRVQMGSYPASEIF